MTFVDTQSFRNKQTRTFTQIITTLTVCSCNPHLHTDMGDFSVNPLVLIGVGSSFAFSGLFYHLYQEKKKELMKLKVSSLLFKSI